MKGTWGRPAIKCERFVANDYVAACGKTPTGQYIFTCDAPAGDYYEYEERTVRNFGLFLCRPETEVYARYRGSYHPCGATHITSSSTAPEYFEGFIDRNGNGREDADESALMWWGPDEHGRTGHATISLTPEEIETVRS